MKLYTALRNVYITILIHSIYTFSEEIRDGLPYGVIKWLSRILWTCLLPIMLTGIILKVVKKNITNEDAEESVDSASKTMVIYGELSEFEWRSELTVYDRICTSVTKNAEIKSNSRVFVINLDDIVIALVMGNNFFCKMRQETEEEFVARRVAEYIAKHENTISDEDMAQVKDVFTQQFVLITKNGKGDLFKEFYLGRSLMFLKVNGGNSKQKPRQKEMIPVRV